MQRIISGLLAFVMVIMVIQPVIVSASSIPTAVTEAPEATYRSATLHGYITANGGYDITEYGYVYGINDGETQYEKIEGSLLKNVDVPFTIELEPGYGVWYQFYAKNELGTHKGEIKYINGPTFTVESYDTDGEQTSNSIYMEGEVLLDYGSADSDLDIGEIVGVMVGFEYGLDKQNTELTSFNLYTQDMFYMNVEELEPDTIYYFRAVAYENYAGNKVYSYGDWIEIKTKNGEIIPTVVTEEPTNVSIKSIEMHGYLADTNDVMTEYGFSYSLDQELWMVKIIGENSESCSFSAVLDDFAAGNTVYYRAFADNTYGRVYFSWYRILCK